MDAQNSALIFIPDISGFTQFVKETEIKHSQHIIAELLELIIDANEMNLEVSEIEGDAVLFFRFGKPPSLKEVADQCKNLFIKFHQHLKQFERDRICQCGACVTTQNLTIKVLAHYGEVSTLQVKDHSKLIGEAVIVAHRLLKNNVDSDEYVLSTRQFMDCTNCDLPGNEEWLKLETGSTEFSDIGKMEYSYFLLTPLMAQVHNPPPQKMPELTNNPIVATATIAAPILDVHHAMTDFETKKLISDELIDVVYDKTKVPRVGTQHDCVLPQGTLKFETLANEVKHERIVFAESVDNLPILRGNAISKYQFDAVDESNTDVKVEFHFKPKNILDRLLFKLLHPVFKKNNRKGVELVKYYLENRL